MSLDELIRSSLNAQAAKTKMSDETASDLLSRILSEHGRQMKE